MSDPYSGGGGFMAGGPSSQGGGDSPQKARGNQSLRPITIKQFLSASQPHPDADFIIDDVDVNQVTVVAIVRNLANQATNVSITLEDGTGQCDARLWLDTTADSTTGGQMEGITQDMYVRVVGTVKTFSNKRHLAATHIRPIKDHNEVFYHLLECQYVSLVMKKGKLGEGGAQAQGGGGGAGANMNDYSGGGGGGGGGGIYADLTPIHRKVMEFVASAASEEGLHVKQIAQKVSGFNSAAILDAIEWLISDGHLYTTVDDEHVLPT
ncbi:hypothetical protein BDY24DRAFT_383552 [Mrakia frigida]|uniref:Rfa2p n=1 Tax=Mrakia frigida TaxID=29902 RepID=UPI003FCC0C51